MNSICSSSMVLFSPEERVMMSLSFRLIRLTSSHENPAISESCCCSLIPKVKLPEQKRPKQNLMESEGIRFSTCILRRDLIWQGVPTNATLLTPFLIMGSNSSMVENVMYWSLKRFIP